MSLDLWAAYREAYRAGEYTLSFGWWRDWRRAIKADEARLEAGAAAAARAYYKHLPAMVGAHPWLLERDLPVVHGLRADAAWLVVPIFAGGRIVSVLRIGQSGEQRWWPGGLRAGFFPLARPGAALTVVCDGLAPALAVWGAVPTSKVLAVFGGYRPEALSGLVVETSEDWCAWRQARLTERIENKRYRERESEIRRAVDAEIAAALNRAAKFRRYESD